MHVFAGALESFEDAGEAAQVAAAAAAGEFVNVVLYAPGRLLYVRPVDKQVDEDKQHFELVDGRGGMQHCPWQHLLSLLFSTQKKAAVTLLAACQAALLVNWLAWERWINVCRQKWQT